MYEVRVCMCMRGGYVCMRCVCVCCVLELESITSPPQWIRQPKLRGMRGVCACHWCLTHTCYECDIVSVYLCVKVGMKEMLISEYVSVYVTMYVSVDKSQCMHVSQCMCKKKEKKKKSVHACAHAHV